MATSYCTILKLDNKEIAISFFTKLIASQILSPILECLSNSNLTDVEESVAGLNGKTFKLIYSYSFWNVYLTIYGCDYLRYFTVKGTPENTFNANTVLTARPDCEPVTGYTEFAEAHARTVSFGAGGEIAAKGAGWPKGEYFNVTGMFVATQKLD